MTGSSIMIASQQANSLAGTASSKWTVRSPARTQHLLDLLYRLVEREMKLIYKRSILGVAWTLIVPLMQLLAFTFMFHSVLGVHVSKYASYAFTGLLVWNWFQTSLIAATGCIIKSHSLLEQPGFPVSILPIVSVVTWLIHFAAALPVLLFFLCWDGAMLTPAILLMPLLLVLQAAFTLSLAYPLSALNVPMRDTQHTLTVLLNLAIYVTPVFYTIDKVPAKYQIVFQLNPMRHFLDAYRSILLHGQAPNWIPLTIVFALTCCLIPMGHWLFMRQSARFVEDL
jgi:lipopolysaccharide transport system permease protein